jgi:FkbH-like protein
MKSVIQPFNDFYKSRIAQLSQRSNQFNPRTIRYSEEDLEILMNSCDYETRSFLLKDKFGDYGLISNIILKKEGNTLKIENWVMSCRVLKRNVEDLVINEVMSFAKEYGFSKVVAEYIPTSKNKLVNDLYSKIGFTEVESNYYEQVVANYINKEHQIKID